MSYSNVNQTTPDNKEQQSKLCMANDLIFITL